MYPNTNASKHKYLLHQAEVNDASVQFCSGRQLLLRVLGKEAVLLKQVPQDAGEHVL